MPELLPLTKMISPAELDQVAPGLFLWQAYDPKAKVELFSTAIAAPHGVLLVDPTLLSKPALAQLGEERGISGIVVTNSNHLRASNQFAEQFSVPIFAHRASFPDQDTSRFIEVTDGAKICEALEVITIEGAASGEIVLHSTENGGVLIVGDAFINFEPHGFTFLPAKYCSNQKEMRRSLRKLLDRKAERLFFAHGLPILTGAGARLQQLLAADR